MVLVSLPLLIFFDRNNGESNSGWQTSNIFTDTGLIANTQYIYRFKVKDAIDNISDFFATASKITLSSSPTNFSATPDKKYITLSVGSFPNDTASSSGYYFSRPGVNSGWIQTNTWQDTGLSCNTSYTYSVKYRNIDGVETEPSNLTQKTNSCGGRLHLVQTEDIITYPIVVEQSQKTSSTPSTITVATTSVVSASTSVTITMESKLSFTQYLKLGNSGAEVAKLQNFLIDKGYSLPSGITGYFGKETQSALLKYQKNNNITPTGTLGPITRNYINNNVTTTPVTPTSTSTSTKYIFNNNLKLNSVSEDVRQLQIYLNNNGYTIAETGPGSKGKETTTYGQKTVQAVKKLQEAHRSETLTPNGFTSGTGMFYEGTRKWVNNN